MLTSVLQFAADEPEGIDALGIDPIAIILQAGAFLLLFFLIKKYALDSIRDTVKDREDTINEGIDNAVTAKKNLEDADVQKNSIIAGANKQAAESKLAAKKEGDTLIAQAEEKAALSTETKIQEAKVQIESAKKTAEGELKKETAALVADASEKLLRETLDVSSGNDLITKIISDLEASDQK